MTGITALHLARAQFAFTISFHFIFPAFSIGLASYLTVLEALWLKTGKQVYEQLYPYWVKIFAGVFGMGVVSGVVMSYQFGTNWSVFSDRAGPIVGPLMAATFAQGVTLGALLQGIKIGGRAYAGGYWDWLTPFSVLTGAGLVTGYGLLGARLVVLE